MTDPPAPSPRRGRPVSQAARQAVLDAAVALLDERGWGGFTVDEAARRSGVSKATIYKHWPDGFALAVEAYGESVTTAVPTGVPTATGADVPELLADQVERLAAFYASPRGQIAGQLLGAGVGRVGGAALVREHFFGRRRAETLALIDAGKARGQLRRDVDSDLALDLLFGPIVFRLFNGLEPLGPAEAATIAGLALRALAG